MSSEQDSRKKPAGTKRSDEQPGQRDMGKALRSVYQRAIDEAVPDEMLDLLGKLN